jgi:hypothetical protein
MQNSGKIIGDGLYQRKVSRETVIIDLDSDGEISQSPTTIVAQVDSDRNISVPHLFLTTTITS